MRRRSAQSKVLIDRSPANFSAGIKDLPHATNPTAIRANTTMTMMEPDGVTLSAPVVGGGVVVNDQLVFSTIGGNGGIQTIGGIELSFMLQPNCNGAGFRMALNGYVGAYQLEGGFDTWDSIQQGLSADVGLRRI